MCQPINLFRFGFITLVDDSIYLIGIDVATSPSNEQDHPKLLPLLNVFPSITFSNAQWFPNVALYPNVQYSPNEHQSPNSQLSPNSEWLGDIKLSGIFVLDGTIYPPYTFLVKIILLFT